MDQGQKRENWLKYSPFIYSYLSLHPISDLNCIRTVSWLKGPSRHKSSFKFNQNMLCIGGYRSHPQGNRSIKQGVISLYNAITPRAQELDDDRLRPIFQPKGEIIFPSSVKQIQQFSLNPNKIGNLMNNAFAVTFEENNQIHLISINKLIQDSSVYSRYGQKQQVGVLTQHEAPITQIKWAKSKTGREVLFSSSLDSMVYQWDLEKMMVEREMKFHRGHVIDISVINDPLKADKSDLWPQGPQISQKYTLASLGADGDIFFWDSRSKNPVQKINLKQGGQITSMACLSSEALITGTIDGKIQFWDLKKKQKYQYDTKFDIKEGHKATITKIKLNRQLNSTQPKNKAIGKISFTTTSADGKIIQWQDKIQFVHEGHSSLKQKEEQIKCCFDRREDCDIYASASNLESMVMLWQPGVSLLNVQR